MENERKIELVKEFYDLDISHDINDFDNVDCNIYSESTADGYDVYIITNNTRYPAIREDVYYYNHDLAEIFNEHIRWGDRTFYIESYIYDECYFEGFIATDVFDDLINGRDFNSFMQMGIITEEELEYLKEEYGIEDEETTEA